MESNNAIIVRRVSPGTAGNRGDAQAVAAIYDDAVRTTTATFDTEPKTIANRAAWLASHDARFSAFIAEDTKWKGPTPDLPDSAIPEATDVAGAVVGWATISRWSERCAYDGTGETSIYVRPDARGRGVGTILTRSLVDHARGANFHVLLARIVTGNEASERMHAALGFQRVGVMKEVGWKFERWLDVGLWELML